MNAVSKERVGELTHAVLVAAGFVRDDERPVMTKDDCADLLTILDEYSKSRIPSIAGELIDREYAEDDDPEVEP